MEKWKAAEGFWVHLGSEALSTPGPERGGCSTSQRHAQVIPNPFAALRRQVKIAITPAALALSRAAYAGAELTVRALSERD